MLEVGEHMLNPIGNNAYYTQVQFGTHCTGTGWCKFIVFGQLNTKVM